VTGATEHVAVTSAGGVATITLAGAPANALSLALLAELRSAVGSAPVHGARVVVIASRLPRFFAAGADLKLLATLDGEGFAAYLVVLRSMLDDIAALPQPTIAALGGMALGGGLELALACALRVASPGARLGLPEVRLGLLPGAGGTQRLPRLVGRSRALDLLLTGRAVDGEEALRLGLVDRLAADADAEAAALAAQIAAFPAAATRAIGRCVAAAAGDDPGPGMRTELAELLDLFAADEGRAGIAAFVARRAAVAG
jgi:enoyl-CoA hydratase/carnithine racemase